ncbi:MAG: preprotein translocase subunit SecE [Clostridia bacterium]|nr:preprotein translocase subunit SecE [Clostridia bacterium]
MAEIEKKVKKPSFFSRTAAWFRTTKAELKKIAWTPRKVVLKNTALVLVAMVLLGAVISGLDALFKYVVYGLSMII